MSDAATNRGGVLVAKQSDYWELTNYGTNAIDLSGYQFADIDEVPRPLFPSGDPLTIASGESIVFVRSNVTTNEAQFRAWWGACVPAGVQMRFYPAPGFNANRESVIVYDALGQVLDRVDFGEARNGVSFISNTNTGVFGAFSQSGACGACQAEGADDIGSPGRVCEPVPLQLVQQPVSQVGCLGKSVTLTVRAIGLPRPRYQWLFNEVSIPGANGASYTITNSLPSHAGAYRVRVENGLTTLTSVVATLSFETNPVWPTIVSPPVDMDVYVGQNARFSVVACALPAAQYQWHSNGVPIPGANGPVLRVLNCVLAMSGTEYCVRVSNALGTNTACARLAVGPKPDLSFTEMFTRPNPDCFNHSDWFEITNLGTNAVNLQGCRFSQAGETFAGAITITQAVWLAPGRSAVFVETLTADEFTQWWGAGNLSPDLSIVTYEGFGLSAAGDTLYLWNAAAEDSNDYLTAGSCEAAAVGVSWRRNETNCLAGCVSTVGAFGAFRAVECGEIGSPGYVENPAPRLLNLTRSAGGFVQMTLRVVEGNTYRLERNNTLHPSDWISLGDFTATNSLLRRVDATAMGQPQRFYRVLQLSP